MTDVTPDSEFYHPTAKRLLDRLQQPPLQITYMSSAGLPLPPPPTVFRLDVTGALRDIVTQHARCGTGSGVCDDGGHAGDDGCYVLTRLAELYFR
jgi:hypothetical protein